jgi:hypothetical protein
MRGCEDARLICNLLTGACVKPEAMWTMMKQLKNRIIRMLESGTITNDEEKQKLDYLIKSKKMEPLLSSSLSYHF